MCVYIHTYSQCILNHIPVIVPVYRNPCYSCWLNSLYYHYIIWVFLKMGDHQNHDLTWMIWGVPPWLRKFHVYHCISLWYSIYVPLSFHSTHFGIVPRLAVLKIHRRWFHPWHFRGFQVFKLPSKSTSTMIIHEQSQLPTKKNTCSIIFSPSILFINQNNTSTLDVHDLPRRHLKV